MLESRLCDYSNVYIILWGTITVTNRAVAPAKADDVNKKVVFKSYASFTDCI